MSNHETEQLVAGVFRFFQHQAKHPKRYAEARKLAERIMRPKPEPEEPPPWRKLHEAARAAEVFSRVALSCIEVPNDALLDKAHWDLIIALEGLE